jgi:hypothetical protein
MGACSKCNKEIAFHEDHVIFKRAVIVGIFPEYLGRQVCMKCQHDLLDSKNIPYEGPDLTHRSTQRIQELYAQTKREKKA